MGGWPGMIEMLKMHGVFLFFLRPMEMKVAHAFHTSGVGFY